MTRIAATVSFLTAALAAVVLPQAQPRTITLGPADAALGDVFTGIASVRELSDRRVLISDNGAENRLVANLGSGATRRIGNVGAGPREYRQAGMLFPLPADSTLLIDSPQRGRWWLLLHHDSIVANLPPDLAALRIVGGTPAGVDDRGRVLGVRPAGAERLANNRTRENLVVIVAARNSSRADTIATLRGNEHQISQAGTRDRPFWTQVQLQGSAPEQALMLGDGWTAIVRVDPYRVEWLSPLGAWVRGPELAWERPRADAREKAAAFQRLKQRYGDRATADDGVPWVERLAPIRSRALIATPEGNLLVLRSQWSEAPDTRYDLIDRGGRRIAQLALPDSEVVAGFGARSIYISVRDNDGFYHLRRHPWP